jgi:putative transposase
MTFWRTTGAPRIPGELLRLGIDVAERTVSRLMPRRQRTVSRLMPNRPPEPSQTWRAFLANHGRDLVSIDFFTVPTARLRVLFVLVVLAHHRRRAVHFNATEHPTAQCTAQQIVDGSPDDSAPGYLLRDRDRVYGQHFRHRVKGMRIEEVLADRTARGRILSRNDSSARSGASA